MNRRKFIGYAAAAASVIPIARVSAAPPMPKAPNVVLVHGLFADGSCWSEIIPRLQAAGLNATAVQNPLTTLEESVAATERVLALQDGPTVLVGHSFSGMIVSEAGVDPKVRSLVYVAARAPDAGEDYTALAKNYPTPPASAGIVFSGDEGQSRRGSLPARFRRRPAGRKGEGVLRRSGAVPAPPARGKTTQAAWRSKPSYYAVSTEDRTINPDLERFMAKRMGAKTIEVKASHLSLISQPDIIANLILQRPATHKAAKKAGPSSRERPVLYCALDACDWVAAVTRHTVLPTSSAISSAPVLSSVTPTGRPCAWPPVEKARDGVFRHAVRLAVANGTNTTL